MSLRTENISLNCKKAYFQTIIENLHVGDVKSTQLVFTLTDGIKEIELPDGKTTAIIHGKKPDGTEIHNDCTVENNKIYYTLTAQDTAVSGIVDYMLDVTVNRDEQYERAYMPTFRTRVSDRIYSPAYRELETEPEHWERDYKNYYRKEGNAYIQIDDNVCPTFAPGTFYVLIDPPVESASEFLAFYSAFNKVSELFDKRLVIDSTTTDIEYSPENIHKVFIYATIGSGIKGVVFTAATGNQYAVCSDGLLRKRTYSGSYSDWEVVALETTITDSNKNKDNRVPSIKAVVDYIASAISGKADTANVNAALATKANKTYVDTELGKKADINHSHPVDSEFSQTSTNPIENRKVTEEFNKITKNVNTALAGKANVNHTHDMSNYVTLHAMITALANKADISDIPTVPTNVSAFNNDAGYITNSDIDLPGKANYREVNIENINNATNPNTVYRVSLGMNDGVPEYATIICPRSGDLSNLNHTQYAFTNLGRVLIRKCINGVWESSFTDLIPEGADISGKADKTYVDTELNKKADKTEIPTKISAFTNDVGYLTQHQDISGKENTSNKKTEISSTHQSTEDTFYPTSGAVRRFVSASTEAQDEYNAETFAQKSTTLSGYGITNAYTKTEVDNALSSKADSSAIPTKTSQLNNDSGFLTQHQDISGKVDKVTGKGLSTNDYTTAEKNKLASLEPGNSIWKTTTAPTAPDAEQNLGYGFTISTLTGADRDVQIGDMVLYTYYYYNITAIIGTVAYAKTRVSIRGAKGATGGSYNLTDKDKADIAGLVDISGKENTSNKKTSISNQSQAGDSDTNYPTVGAVRDFVNFVKDDLEDYVDDEIGATPQYVIDESESVLAKAFAHKGLGRTIRFIAVSDSHNDATKTSHDYTRVSNLHCGQAVKYIADRIPLDFVASLGDMTWAGVAHTTAQYQTDWLKADIQEMNMFLKDGFSGVPNIRCVGNHDQCATTGSGGTVSRLQNNGAYQYFGRYNAGVNDGLSNYGYYDIDNVKLRIIYLNTSDTVSTSTQGTLLGVSQEQKNWLCETFIDVNSKTDAANWKILLLSHAPLDMVSGIAADILIPYTNGGTYGSYTFTNHSAKIIGNCHGHTHCYNIGYISDVIRRFTIPNSNFYDNNHYKDNANYSAWNEDTTYPKTENSRTDTSFSLVTVDLDSLTCYVDNYGAGYDREFSLDYKSAPAPVNLFDKNDADVVLRARFNSSHVPASWDASQLITGYIEVTAGDTFTVSGDNTQNLNVYTGVAQLYNSNKEYIGIYSSPVQDPTHQKWVWAADYLSGSLDTSVAPNNGTNSGAAYIRFCLAYTNIDNLVITK